MIVEGYIANCYLHQRETDPTIFEVDNNTLTIRLNNYAIIPMEIYRMLQQLAHLPEDEVHAAPNWP
jgi:hypothetical protein